MSARLFVDCDDTLVIYENDRPINPYGAVYGEPYRLNTDLIEAIDGWDGPVFIWSGGGVEYARRWGREIWPSFHDWGVPLGKDIEAYSLVRPNDTCVDDLPLNVPGTVMTADEFIAARKTA